MAGGRVIWAWGDRVNGRRAADMIMGCVQGASWY